MAVTGVDEKKQEEGGSVISGGAKPAVNLNDMFSRMSSQSGWTGEYAEYLEAIRKRLSDPSMPFKAEMRHISEDAVAFISGKDALILLRVSDIVNIPQMLAEVKFFNAAKAFENSYPGLQLLNIISVNRFMLNRAEQMASHITQLIMAKQDENVRNFNVNNFGPQHRIMIDTEMSNVRQFMEMHSPNPVVCGDIGFIASVVDTSVKQFDVQTSTNMFAVTGYTEFLRDGGSGTFTPVIHVTDIVSVAATPRILALALPLIAEIFVTRGLWRQPFTATAVTGINIGNLIVDGAGKPFEVKSDIDFQKMFREYVSPPILCIDIKSGAPMIPGLIGLTQPQEHGRILTSICDFLQVNPQNIPGALGENIFREIIGVVEMAKTGKFANLIDTRELTYLYLISKLKYNPKLEQLLYRVQGDPQNRFNMIKDQIGGGEVTATHSSITNLLHGEFLKSIAMALSAKVNITAPQMMMPQNINVTDFSTRAFQPTGMTMFGTVSGPSNLTGGGWLR